SYNDVVRRINLNGTITTVAGTVPVSGSPTFCSYPDEGRPATQVCLDAPVDLTLDAGGNLYLAESGGFPVPQVAAGGGIRAVAGHGNGFCGDGGPATGACVSHPSGVAFDQAGNLLVSADGRIRRIDSAGRITTVAGHGPWAFCGGEGGPAPAAC